MTDASLQALLESLPADVLYAAEQDMWVRLEADGSATIGVSHLATAHGEIMFFAPRPNGTPVARDRSLGVMETAKTAMAIHAPLTCTTLVSNEAVARDATLITRDPYGDGWLFRVQPTQWVAERATLMDAPAYRAWLATRMDRFKRPTEDAPDDVINPTRWY